MRHSSQARAVRLPLLFFCVASVDIVAEFDSAIAIQDCETLVLLASQCHRDNWVLLIKMRKPMWRSRARRADWVQAWWQTMGPLRMPLCFKYLLVSARQGGLHRASIYKYEHAGYDGEVW